MTSRAWCGVGVASAYLLAGCGFKTVSTGQVGSGGAAGSGARTGQGGSPSSTGGTSAGGAGSGGTTSGTGGRMSAGTGGDVGIVQPPPTCGQKNVAVMPQPPDILIVQDRSLSMTDDASGKPCTGGTVNGNGNCGATSKWAQVVTAIDQVVMRTQTTVNWGLMFLGDESTMCGAATAPVVPITPQTSYQPIQSALAGVQFTGDIGTPTTAVINNAVTYLQTLTDKNPKYLLLATDGEPNCARGSANNNDDVGAENAVAAAKAAGFPTFVVGIATAGTTATDALNTMAVNGGEAQTGAATKYYAVTDTADLLDVLGKILTSAMSCTIPLTGVDGDLDKVVVSAKDASGQTVQIPEDGTNGWSYTDASKTAIVLNGDACHSLQTVTYTGFQFVYTCSTGVICIDNCPAADAGTKSP